MSNLGIGVMIGILGGNEETVLAVKSSLGKTIKDVSLSDGVIRVALNDGSALSLRDDGQSCCESRYIITNDVLGQYSGAKLLDIEIREAPSVEDEYGEHEVQFLVLKTNKGNITFETHNEHNGYYGGFHIVASKE